MHFKGRTKSRSNTAALVDVQVQHASIKHEPATPFIGMYDKGLQCTLQTLRYAMALLERASELLLFMPTHLKSRTGGKR